MSAPHSIGLIEGASDAPLSPPGGNPHDGNASITTHRDGIHLVQGSSFTAEQLEARRFTLGASEVSAVLGLDQYKTPFDVYASKRGIAPPFAGNEYTEWGLRMEPVIRQKASEVLGVPIASGGDTLIHPIETWMSATPDGYLEHNGRPALLEMKNKTERQAPKWGVSGTDEVPYDIATQVHWQMEVAGRDCAVVAVLFGKADFRLYYLERDPEIIAAMMDACRTFWFEHVVADLPPAITAGATTRAFLKERFARHGDVMRDASRDEDQLIAQLREVKGKTKALETEKESLEHKLMAVIGADAGLVGRSGRVTWKAPAGHTTTWKDVAVALKAPDDLIAKFSTPHGRRFLATFPKGE